MSMLDFIVENCSPVIVTSVSTPPEFGKIEVMIGVFRQSYLNVQASGRVFERSRASFSVSAVLVKKTEEFECCVVFVCICDMSSSARFTSLTCSQWSPPEDSTRGRGRSSKQQPLRSASLSPHTCRWRASRTEKNPPLQSKSHSQKTQPP